MITPRDNCGECESFKYYKPHFQCHWCDGRCLHKTGQCHSSAATQCPQPTIQKVRNLKWPCSVKRRLNASAKKYPPVSACPVRTG